MREEELIIYKEFGEGEILKDMVWLMEHNRSGEGQERQML